MKLRNYKILNKIMVRKSLKNIILNEIKIKSILKSLEDIAKMYKKEK